MGVLDSPDPIFEEHTDTPNRLTAIPDARKIGAREFNNLRTFANEVKALVMDAAKGNTALDTRVTTLEPLPERVTTLEDRTAGRISVLESIPSQYHAGIAAGMSSVDVSGWIQDALDEVAAAHQTLVLPAGGYKVAAGIAARGSGFGLKGEGGAVLLASGAITGPILDLVGVSSAHTGGFKIASAGGLAGTDSADIALRLWWDGTGGASYHDKLGDIVVADCRCVTGIQIGADPSAANGLQTSENWLPRLVISGHWWTTHDAALWQKGLVIGSGVSGNNLNHWLAALACASFAQGVVVDRCGCTIMGCSVAYNGVDFALVNAGFPVTVVGYHSEGSGRMLTATNAPQAPATFKGVTWAVVPDSAHADERIVMYEGHGALTIDGFDVKCSGAAVGSYAPKVYFTGHSLELANGRLAFTGATPATLLEVPVGGTSAVHAKGITFIDGDYNITGSIGDIHLNATRVGLGIGPTADVWIDREAAGVGGAALELYGGGGVKVTGGTDQSLLVTKASGDAIRLGTDGTNIRLGSGADTAIGSDPSGVYTMLRGETYFAKTAHSDVASGGDAFKAGNNGARVHFGSGASSYLTGNGSNVTSPSDLEVTDSAKGVILKSPDGTRYRVTVADGGTLAVAAV